MIVGPVVPRLGTIIEPDPVSIESEQFRRSLAVPRPLADDADWDDDTDGDDPDDDEPTVPCPYCQRPIPEDAPRCPYCEQYISAEDAPATRKPWWLYLGAGLCLYAVYRWTAG